MEGEYGSGSDDFVSITTLCGRVILCLLLSVVVAYFQKEGMRVDCDLIAQLVQQVILRQHFSRLDTVHNHAGVHGDRSRFLYMSFPWPWTTTRHVRH
jgi:hypothetical protein